MQDKTQRINVTPVATQDFEMIQLLSDLSRNSLSSVVGLALHEWLKDNFVEQVKRHQEIEHLLNETGIPNHLHNFGEDK